MQIRFGLTTFLFCAMVAARPLSGQAPVAHDDTTSAAGLRDGRAEAAKVSVSGRGVASLGGGLIVGFVGPFALFGGSIVATGIAGAGGGIIVAAAESGRTAPSDSLAVRAANRGNAYSTAFTKGYSDHLQSRRRKASFIAGGVGTGAGVGVLLLLIAAAFNSGYY
jgi:hypothetical protein